MKLESCYIAHFGKIENFSYEFSDGLNAILQENGWGKTTFSVFLKSMFFGMEYSPNTKKKLMDRNHYLPWDGSLCGGNIVFSAKGKTYRIERTFGKTDKDDTFKLFDMATGLESEDFTENIGEELFRVDRDSFEKSVYIPQLHLNTGMTDSLNAKMGNLASAKDDISNFDRALKAVKDARADYTRTSKVNPGKLHALKQEMSRCKEDYEKLPIFLETFENQNCYLEEKQERLEFLQKEKAELVEKIQLQSKKEQELGAYRLHKENLLKEQNNLEQLDVFFAAGIPTADEMAILEETDRELEIHERALAQKLSEQKKDVNLFSKPFEERIPDEDEFSMWNNLVTKLSELRAKAETAKLSEDAAKQLSELKFFFSKRVPTSEELSNIEKQTTQITTLDGRIDQATERLMRLKAEKSAEEKVKGSEGSSIKMTLGIIMFFGFVAASIIFMLYADTSFSLTLSAVFAALAIIDLIILLAGRHKTKKNQEKRHTNYEDTIGKAEEELESYKAQRQALEEECGEFLSYFLLTRADTMAENVYEIRRNLDIYTHLLDEEAALHNSVESTLDELADLQLELYTKIQPFANAYGINLYDMGGEFEFLAQLKKDADKYSKHLLDMEEIAHHENCIKVDGESIASILNRYPLHYDTSRSEQIHDLSAKVTEYTNLQSRISELAENVKQFESTYNIDEEVESVDELQKKQVEIDDQILELNRQITQERENILRSSEEIERLSDIAEQLDRLEEKHVEYATKTDLLEMTSKYLQEARESFLSKYMGPLQEGLHKYLSLIDVAAGDNSGFEISSYELDMDLSIKISYDGNSKSAEYLSQGYQDMVALSSRLALVDVIYPDERPVLILDDPFTNLDEEKIGEALKLIKEIAKERQTIYFTCHESRL